MPQSGKSTIHINMGELEILVRQLKQLKDALDGQRYHISQIQRELDHAISGTAANIRKFDDQFDSSLKLLKSIITDVDSAYSTLKSVHLEAQEHDIEDVLEALKKGSKAMGL